MTQQANIIVLGLFVLCTPIVSAQATAKPAPQSVPVHVRYWAFFGHVSRLEQSAMEAETAGRNGDDFRRYYKRRLVLTESEHAALRSVSLACDAAVKQQDAAAKAVIKRARDQYLADRAKNGVAQITVPPELAGRQTDRDSTIQRHIDRLRAEMGIAGFQKVDAYITNGFLKSASVTTANPPSRLRTFKRPPTAHE